MVCDKCLKNLETRFFEKFNNKNLCYNCAKKEEEQEIREAERKAKRDNQIFLEFFDIQERVEYKFKRLQEELDEEKDYSESADKFISKCYKLFENRSINELLKIVNSLINRKDITESEYFYDIFFDYIADWFRNDIYVLLEENNIEAADELSKLWMKLYPLIDSPCPGWPQSVRGDVIKAKGKVDEAFDYYFQSFLLSYEDSLEWEFPHEEEILPNLKETWNGLKKIIEHLKRDSDMLGVYEKELVKEKKVKQRHFKHTERQKLARIIPKYMKDCNEINKRKNGKYIFNPTNKTYEIQTLDKTVNSEKTWKEFINDLYQLIYEGSGSLQRIPKELLENNAVFIDIKHLRNEKFHDLEHGDKKEIQKKNLKLKEIYLKYTKKESLPQLSPKDIDNFSLEILKELKITLGSLLKYLKKPNTCILK